MISTKSGRPLIGEVWGEVVVEKEAGSVHVQIVPVRMTVEVSKVNPRHAPAATEPILIVRLVIDLNPNPQAKTFPIWFNATVKVFADLTSEILSFQPTYGGELHNQEQKRLVSMYEHAFARSLVRTNLKILGVRS